MPRLPDTYAALPTPQPGRAIAGYDGGAVARALVGAGDTLGQIADNFQRENDAQAVYEARRKLDDWERANIYDPEKGAIALRGRDAFGLPQQIPQSFDQASAEIGKTLLNDRQRQAFGQISLSRREQVTNWANSYALQQRQVFNEEQYQADLKSMTDRAAMVATADPQSGQLPAQIAIMQQRIIGRGHDLGWPESYVAEQVKQNTSQVHLRVLQTMLEANKPRDAQNYLDQHGAALTFDDYMKAKKFIDQETDAMVAFQKANSAVQATLPAIAPSDGQRMLNLVVGADKNLGNIYAAVLPKVVQAESGGRQYGADGQILQGPMTKQGTAKGDMQVMDATAASPGFGVTPARDNSPEERSRVGRDYLMAMLKRYAGDGQDGVAKALAAYNWGPGNVDEAVMRAKARPGGDWFAMAPAETRAYVTGILKQFDGGGGRPPAPTLQDIHTQLRNDPELASRPARLKAALEQATAQFNDYQNAKKASDEQAIADAMRGLVANGGRVSLLPASVRNAIPPEKYDDVLKAGQRIAEGDNTSDPRVYLQLTNPNALKSLTDNQFLALQPYLSTEDQKHFATQRAHLLNPEVKPTDPGDVDMASFKAALDTRLQQMRLEAHPKAGDTSAEAAYSDRYRMALNSVLDEQRAAGKKFNDAEMNAAMDRVFLQNVTFRRSLFGMQLWSKTDRAMNIDVSNVPSDVVKTIKADLARRGNPNPTDSDILQAFYESSAALGRLQNTPQRQSGQVR